MGSAFAGGMYVFPGGRVEGDDHLHAYDPYRTGPSEAQQPQLDAIGHEWRGFWIAAIEETFEEAGVLLAYNDLGQLVTLEGEKRERFEAYRHAIHDGTLDLETLCKQEEANPRLRRVISTTDGSRPWAGPGFRYALLHSRGARRGGWAPR